MEVLLICYIIQIPLALYAAFGVAQPPGLGEKTQRLRNLVIGFGIAPCGPLSIFLQVAYLLMYLGAVKLKDVQGARQERAFKEATGGAKTSSGSNPFGGSSVPKPASSEANPFGASTPAAPAIGRNPFGDASGPAAREEQGPDNPFA